MITVALADAKARLSELVDLVDKGETVSITRRGRPVARLVAEEVARRPIDIEEMLRIAAMSKPYVDPDGLSYNACGATTCFDGIRRYLADRRSVHGGSDERAGANAACRPERGICGAAGGVRPRSPRPSPSKCGRSR